MVRDFEQLRMIAAKGNIEVSEKDFLELQVGSVDDLEFLEQLSPGALRGLTITQLDAVDCVDLQFEFPSVGSIRFSRKER